MKTEDALATFKPEGDATAEPEASATADKKDQVKQSAKVTNTCTSLCLYPLFRVLMTSSIDFTRRAKSS